MQSRGDRPLGGVRYRDATDRSGARYRVGEIARVRRVDRKTIGHTRLIAGEGSEVRGKGNRVRAGITRSRRGNSRATRKAGNIAIRMMDGLQSDRAIREGRARAVSRAGGNGERAGKSGGREGRSRECCQNDPAAEKGK